MAKEKSFEDECRARFLNYCRAYRTAPYHVHKRMYLAKAYEQIDAYLDWRDVQGL